MKASIITVVVAVLLSAGVAVALHTAPASTDTPKVGGTSPIDQVNYHCWAGDCEYFGSKTIATATSTACAIQSPAATSTLIALSVRVDVASSTATNWFFGTGTTQFATSSAIGSTNAIAGGKQGYLQASTSPAAASNTVLAPNTWVLVQNNLGITAADTVAGGFVPSGTCIAQFNTPQS